MECDRKATRQVHIGLVNIRTIIKTTSVCDGDASSVGGGRGWLAGDGGRGQPASSRR